MSRRKTLTPAAKATHELSLLTTRKKTQRVCPLYDCDFHVRVKP